MKLLLDTHLLVYLLEDERLLRPKEIEALANAEEIVCSAVSLWELALKWRQRHPSGDRKGPINPGTALSLIRAAGTNILPLGAEVVIADVDPPIDHSDPFDRMLLTQAQQGGYRLLTRDSKMKGHPVAIVSQ